MTLTTVPAEVKFDRWKRPLIKQADGKEIAYTRATTVAGATEDLSNLIDWKVGKAVLGIVDRPDLLLSAAAHRDDKRMLKTICNDALEAGGATSAATIGTALHSFIEKINRGEPTGTVPADYKADVAAYAAVMARFEPLHIEERVVLDEYLITGTPDLIVTYKGVNYIADLKTGSVDYPHKMAAQLGIYANGRHYNHDTGQRTDLPHVNTDIGIIIHLPAGTGKCKAHFIDIKAGWENVRTLAVPVREWRKRKDLIWPFDDMDLAEKNLVDAGLIDDPILARIQAAQSSQELNDIWRDNKSEWNAQYLQAGKERTAQLAS